MSKIAIIAKLTAASGQRDQLQAVAAEQGMANVADEDGTLVYALHADKGDPDVLWFYELYEGDEAVAIHGGSDGMKAVGKAMAPYMAGRPEIFMLDPVAAKGLDL